MSSERDWHSYNEALVRRGELELDSSVIEEWEMELAKANDGKNGEPYHYPESYIRFLAFVRLLFRMRTGRPRVSCASSPSTSRG
jgi:hypothetical protein